MSDTDLSATSSPAKKGKGKLIIIVLALVLLLGGGGGAYVFLIDPSIIGGTPSTSSSADAGDGSITGGSPTPAQTIIPLDEIIVNIRDREFQRIFKLKISVELTSGNDFETVQQKIPVLLDSFQSHIRGMRITEIEGSRAIYRIKEELISRANVALHPVRIKNILFAEMLLQ